MMSSRVRDLTGQRFGKWLVLHFVIGKRDTNKRGAVWMCRCDCGTVKPVKSQSLTKGASKSCGCGNKGIRSKPITPIQRAVATPSKVAVNAQHSSDRSSTEPEDDYKQGYAWRTDRPASPLNNKKLEQHPNGLWKYPSTQPIPDKLMPNSYIPNFKKLRSL